MKISSFVKKVTEEGGFSEECKLRLMERLINPRQHAEDQALIADLVILISSDKSNISCNAMTILKTFCHENQVAAKNFMSISPELIIAALVDLTKPEISDEVAELSAATLVSMIVANTNCTARIAATIFNTRPDICGNLAAWIARDNDPDARDSALLLIANLMEHFPGCVPTVAQQEGIGRNLVRGIHNLYLAAAGHSVYALACFMKHTHAGNESIVAQVTGDPRFF